MSHEESSTTEVKILSSIVRIKNEFESEDETQKNALLTLVNSPIKIDQVTLHLPVFLYTDNVTAELVNNPTQAKTLLQYIRDATISTPNSPFIAMALLAEVFRFLGFLTLTSQHPRMLLIQKCLGD